MENVKMHCCLLSYAPGVLACRLSCFSLHCREGVQPAMLDGRHVITQPGVTVLGDLAARYGKHNSGTSSGTAGSTDCSAAAVSCTA